MRQRLLWPLACGVFAALGTPGPGRADVIVSTLTSPGTSNFASFGDTAYAQQFTLTSGAWRVDQIVAQLWSVNNSSPVPFAQVRADAGGQVGAVLPGTLTFLDPILVPRSNVRIGVSGLTLEQGTYWLVVGNAGPEDSLLNLGVALDTIIRPRPLPPQFVAYGVNTGTAGTANDSYSFSSDRGATWNPADARFAGPDFQRFAVSATAVPEPVSLAVFGGLLAAGGVLLRRRKMV